MSKQKDGETINQGGASKPTRDEAAREYDIAGNVELKGEKPSPGDRDRGETSAADAAAATDIDTAQSRAS